jgi:hypothetical protein
MRDRTVAECERFAEQNGFTGAVAGHFPDLPFPPPPTFLPEPTLTLPPRYARSTSIPRTIVDRVKLFNRNEGDGSDE